MDDEARVIVMMSPQLRDRIKVLAKAEGRVLSRQIEWVLKEYVSEHSSLGEHFARAAHAS